MIHLSVAIGEFFKILLTAIFGTALRLVLMLGLAVAAVAMLALTARAIIRRLRRR